MDKIKLNQINPVIKRYKNESKLLSPNLLKYNNYYYMFFCSREINKSRYGKINMAYSKDLETWERESKFEISPNIINYDCLSLVSPDYIKFNNKHIIFLEAQKDKDRNLICIESQDFINWKINKTFLKNNYNSFYQSPHTIIKEDNIYIFYYKDQKKIVCEILDKDFKSLEVYEALKADKYNENYNIYSPSIIKINKKYFMFYSAWNDAETGNINVAVSQDLKKWDKVCTDLFILNEKINIISELNASIIENKLVFFFEYKSLNNWDLGNITLPYTYFIDLDVQKK